MKHLIGLLDLQLADCEKFGYCYQVRKTYYDQSFGMVCMFSALNPDLAVEAVNLWENKYRKEFEKILYKED